MNRHRIALGIFALDLAASLALYPRLPAQVPVHWGIHGADRFGPPWTLLLLGPGVLALLLLLLVVVERIDPLASRPLENNAPPAERGAFASLVLSLMGLGAVAHVCLLLQLAGLVALPPRWGQLFGPALLILVGNFLPRVRPNYFAGVRTPWTLSSETVWRRTNRLAGKLLFFGGLACAVLVFFAGPPTAMVALLCVVFASAIASILASFLWWRGEQP